MEPPYALGRGGFWRQIEAFLEKEVNSHEKDRVGGKTFRKMKVSTQLYAWNFLP